MENDMDFRTRLSSMIRVHHGPKRWVNLPYAIAVFATFLLALAEEEVSGALLVLFLLFVTQFARPTVAGWAITFGAWFALFFLCVFLFKLTLGAPSISYWTPVLLGLAPLVPLYIFRPRLRDVRGASGTGNEDTSNSGNPPDSVT